MEGWFTSEVVGCILNLCGLRLILLILTYKRWLVSHF